MIEKVHANEYPLSDTVYDLGRTYSKLEHHKHFKQTHWEGKMAASRKNHLGENEQLKKNIKKLKYKPAQKSQKRKKNLHKSIY